MSNYTKTTNFASKDSLPSGNANKIVKGTEIDTEFNNISTAVATKADTAGPTFTGTVTIPTADINGGAVDGTTIGASSASSIVGTTIVANTSINIAGDGATVTGIKDEDDMSSNSATKLATQQSIKAYVDSQVTAQDLDVTDGSSSIDIDLDSESLGILGGTGIDSTASGTGVTLAIDSTVATLTGSQTLTNKTLTAPTLTGTAVVASLDISGDVDVDGTLETDALSINSTTVTSTAAELNILDGVTATASELNILDGVTSTTAELNILDGVTSTAAELNILDGVTSTTAELNILDGVTSTTAELNILDGVTATASELNIMDGVTASTAELNIMDGVTSTTAELNILDGVTSTAAELNILDGKAFLDEDDMSSNSATGIASQQSIKAYVDAQITAEDLDFQADSGGALSIDLDSETLTFTGGTGIDTSGSGNAVTFAIDSTVATLTGSQTLTNKSLTAPTLTGTAVVASLDISGDIDVDGTTNLDVVDIDGAVDMASTLTVGGAVTIANDSDPTLLIRTATADQANSGKISFREASGGTTGVDLRYNGSTNTFIIDTSDVANALTIARTSGNAAFSSNVGIGAAPSDALTIKSDGARISVESEDYVNAVLGRRGSSGADLDKGLLNLRDTGTTKVVLDSAGDSYFIGGNVGIGTTDGDVTSDGNAARTYVGIIGAANRGRLNIGTTASNGADAGTLAFTNGANVLADISVDTTSGVQNTGTVYVNGTRSIKIQAAASDEVVFNESGLDVDFRVESDVSDHGIFMQASDGRVGIGTSAPNAILHVGGTAEAQGSQANPAIQIGSTTGYRLGMYTDSEGGIIENKNGDNGLIFKVKTLGEAMRIDGGTGNVFVGTTNSGANHASDGAYINQDGQIIGRASGIVSYLNRRGSDGQILQLMKDGTSVGSIGIANGDLNINGDTGIRFQASSLMPRSGGSDVDATVDLGLSTHRFKDLHLSGSATVGGITMSGAAGTSPIFEMINNDNEDTDTGRETSLRFSGHRSGGEDVVNAQISAHHDGSADDDKGMLFFYTNNGSGLNLAMKIRHSAAVEITGALSKGSGSFKIDHPLPAKTDTHHLVHSFIEGPKADLIYRGKVDLVAGSATVNIDTAAGMTEGTFDVLCDDVQCFTSNESGWTAVKGSVSENTLTITAQDNTCTDTISWMVVGERKDQHMLDTEWTDENGKVIVEPLKPIIEE